MSDVHANDFHFSLPDWTPRLQNDPLTLSRYPTTLGAALSESRGHLRTVDVDGKVWQWGLQPPPEPTLVVALEDELVCARFSVDGELLAYVGVDSTLHVIELESKRSLLMEKTQEGNCVALCFSADGSQIVAASSTGEILVWGLDSKRLSAEFKTSPGSIQTLAFSRTGAKLAFATNEGTVRLHDLETKSMSQRDLQVGD